VQSNEDTQTYYDEKPNTGLNLGSSQEPDTGAQPETTH
jgi:hypothetical protein